jgi:toxin-antitoxin system PIN domain toxin
MKVLDLNLLLYAVNTASDHHPVARRWVESAFAGEEPLALSWIVVLGFLRIATNPRIQARPLSVTQAMAVVDGWLSQPNVRLLPPGEEHWGLLKTLLSETGTAGNLTTDAHLAALAIENGATLYSTDADFQRFARLRWINPLSH